MSEELRQDCSDAFQRALHYHGELGEIYRYYMPFRRQILERSDTGTGTEGSPRTDVLFDATGVSAAATFAGSMQADWMPLNAPAFQLEAGPLFPDGDDKKAFTESLQAASRIANGVLSTGKIHATVHEMCFDMFAGTAAMFMPKGDEHEPVRGRAVPIMEIALDESPWGDVWHVWWKRRWRAKDIPIVWPRGKISARLARTIKERPREMVEIVQYTGFDHNARDWVLRVWADANCDERDAIIWEERFRVSPWITPRFYKVPGECFGRGLAHLGLPFVKTANKARELALHAAAFAVMGIWTRRNDMTFNPDTAKFQPGAMWQVAYNGGPLGKTIERLPVPQDFDVSSIVMQDERLQIRQVLMDDELPDENDPVKSATEIAGRMKRHSRRYGGVNARIGLEMIVPIAQRTIDVLEQMGYLRAPVAGKGAQTALRIDQLVTQARIVSPAMASQHADQFSSAVNLIQAISMLLGPQAAMLSLKVEELIPEMARWTGLEERWIRKKVEIDQLKAMLAQAAQAQVQAQQQPPPPPTAQDYVNGGGLQ